MKQHPRPQNHGRVADLREYLHGARAHYNHPLTRADADQQFAHLTFPTWIVTGSKNDYVTYLDGILYKMIVTSSNHVELFYRDPTRAYTNHVDTEARSMFWRGLPLEMPYQYGDELLTQLVVDEVKEKLPVMLVLMMI